MSAELLAHLRSVGVVLSIDADGRLAYDAPDVALTSDLLARMRAERDGLLALVDRNQERAAIIELYRDDVVVPKPERLAPMTGVYCPWCRSAGDLVEIVDGLHCLNCNRRAWHLDSDGAIVRCDWLEPRLLEIPAVSIDVVVEKRPTKIERSERSLPGLTWSHSHDGTDSECYVGR